MSIIGFVPHPETAVTVIDWVRTLAEKDEETKFLCLESGTEGHTSHAVRESLGEKDPDATPLIAIDDGISAVLSQLRKESPRLLVTDTFEATTSDGKAQTLGELVLAAPCQTFARLYGGKGPSEVDKILLVISGDVHDRSALGLVETLRKRLQARVTIGVVGIVGGTGVVAVADAIAVAVVRSIEGTRITPVRGAVEVGINAIGEPRAHIVGVANAVAV